MGPISVLGACALSLPTSADADEFMWCVDGSGTTPLFDCAGDLTCRANASGQDVFPLVSDALTAARAEGEPGDIHHICVWAPPTHTEDIAVDNSDGRLGAEVHLTFLGEGQDFCPGSSGGAAITLIGETGRDPTVTMTVSSLTTDFALCANKAARLLEIVEVDLSVVGARVQGLEGDFARQQAVVTGSRLYFFQSIAHDFEGAFLTGTGSLGFDDAEVSGFRPSPGVPLIDLGSSDGFANFTYASLFGSIVRGAPLLRLSAAARANHLTIAGNVVADYDALVEWTAAPGGDLELGSVAFSRNAFVTGAAFSPASPFAPDPQFDPLTQYCLPGPAQGSWYGDRAPPTGGSPAPAGALIDITGALNNGDPSGFVLERSMAVGTGGTPGGAVIRLGGDLGQLDVNLLHNTLDGPFAAVVADGATGGDASITLARNLYVSDMVPALGSNWRTVTTTMETGTITPQIWEAALTGVATDTEIVGPFFAAPPSFIPADDIAALTACERLNASCANFYGDCDGDGPGDGFQTQSCWLDQTIAFFPTQSWSDDNAPRWPWEGDYYLRLPDGDPYNTPGATGWQCNSVVLPIDNDGDGNNPVTDCFDDQSDEGPELPDANGITTSDCLDVPDDCWSCPDGSTLVDAPGDDDDSTAAPAADEGPPEVYVGCLGCGTPIVPPTAVALLPLLALCRRRL